VSPAEAPIDTSAAFSFSFIGAGAGYARHSFSGFTDVGFISDGTTGFGHAANNDFAEWKFAWAVHAGVAYNVNNNFKVELAYRYLNFGNVNTGQFFVLDDEALGVYDAPAFGGVGPTATGTNNVTGNWKPDGGPSDGVGSLAVFDGQNVNGTWRLRITDHAGGDVGFIRSLQLQLPGPASLALFGLAGLVGNTRRRRA
jgi:hypothetical protein